MSDVNRTQRRDEILRLAQGALVQSHGRRRRRRAAAAATTALALMITTAIVVVTSNTSGSRAHETPTPVVVDAPRSPETNQAPDARGAPTIVVERAPIVDDSSPRSPAAPPADVVTGRFEIVTIERPSPGFVEVIDDVAFEQMLRSLPKSTGIAVVGGRTHIVANQEWNPAAPIR